MVFEGPYRIEAIEDGDRTAILRHVATNAQVKRKISFLKKGVSKMPNVTMSMMSPRQAIWQTYISRAGSDAAEAIEQAARGRHIASLMREFDHRIRPEVFQSFPRDLRWHFMRTA